ncbi:hypothetical protein [Microbacterium sp. zg-YB36]|uniref:hypothetical protein n=1 Tax=Microbacterium sp. zg-YB36 TaxID=2969407 RepID=UPI00214C39DF|nr:hypothetical protein [Microbacterium sp. zg-YB36]MDL5351176.1 hypothetical protein [Microbacterium sp. zg-YB36]
MSTLAEQAEAAWADHSIGFTWRDEGHLYGEYRMFMAGYMAGSTAEITDEMVHAGAGVLDGWAALPARIALSRAVLEAALEAKEGAA